MSDVGAEGRDGPQCELHEDYTELLGGRGLMCVDASVLGTTVVCLKRI